MQEAERESICEQQGVSTRGQGVESTLGRIVPHDIVMCETTSEEDNDNFLSMFRRVRCIFRLSNSNLHDFYSVGTLVVPTGDKEKKKKSFG